MTVSANDYIHPQDKAALDNFKSIPFFTTLLKSFMSFFSEQMLHGVSMAQKIRLSEKQLPEIYRLLPPIVSALGIKEPEFYLEMSPIPNAYTQGSTTTFLTVTSGLLEYLDENELRTVIAHECGHIACNHVLYHTMAMYIFNIGVVNMGILSNAALPLQIALYAWMRKSELSADRAAAVAMGGPDQIVETMIKLAGGPESITKNINIEEYIKQADAYDKIKTGTSQDKFLQFLAKTSEDHPFYAERTREILEWCKTDQYSRIINMPAAKGNTCPHCGGTLKDGWKFCLSCGSKL